MLKLIPLRMDKVWGYELWTASTHKDCKQSDFSQAVQGDYPLLVKIIQAEEDLSVQVHPDDETARLIEHSEDHGKAECWYILKAESGSSLVNGLNTEFSKDEVLSAVKERRLDQCLNRTNVKAGDLIFIPAGSIHGIGKGIRLLEVQQTCNITYRLHDWGRKREIHIEKGMKALKSVKAQPVRRFEEPFLCEYFSMEKISSKKSIDESDKAKSIQNTDETVTLKAQDQVELIFICEGKGKIKSEYSESPRNTTKSAALKELDFASEDTFAIFPNETVTLSGDFELIKIVPAKQA